MHCQGVLRRYVRGDVVDRGVVGRDVVGRGVVPGLWVLSPIDELQQ